ncbi:hypothetical protein C3F09_01405 [candidate division GN15 bacterium]|uniref:Shikimate dehydrogenase (NADP(+)) n=1 Tax=candidate division GN15 bacterium TaxID=2072418 RepID=A0A855X764_9BACT|nr:MAG: hypothetical protein C3F09_01405 [candidate division GN15 bacterium]
MKTSWRFGLLGENISYSKSPAIFAAIGEYLKQEIRFEPYDVPLLQVWAVVDRMKSGETDGLAATIPYKKLLSTYVDRCSSEAEAIGAVNCITTLGTELVGHNTDWKGFLQPLQSCRGKLDGAPVMIVGRGGAARAAIYALRNLGSMGEFTVVSRERGEPNTLRRAAGDVPIQELTFDEGQQVKAVTRDCALIVNATPLGGGNYPDGGNLTEILDFGPKAIYYDLNYNDNNGLIKKARQSGVTVIDGKRMLVGQALISFNLWTAISVPFEPIYERVFGSSGG